VRSFLEDYFIILSSTITQFYINPANNREKKPVVYRLVDCIIEEKDKGG